MIEILESKKERNRSIAQLHQANHGAKKSGTDTHLTPFKIIERLPIALPNGYLDPCASKALPQHTGCKACYCLPDNGLLLPWEEPVFCNPPFSESEEWIEKALHESKIYDIPVVLLTKMDARVAWFKTLISRAVQVRVVHGYTRFLNDSGTAGNAAMFQTAISLISCNGDSCQDESKFVIAFQGISYRMLRN
jgi:hypothetical protein